MHYTSCMFDHYEWKKFYMFKARTSNPMLQSSVSIQWAKLARAWRGQKIAKLFCLKNIWWRHFSPLLCLKITLVKEPPFNTISENFIGHMIKIGLAYSLNTGSSLEQIMPFNVLEKYDQRIKNIHILGVSKLSFKNTASYSLDLRSCITD